jgi:CBS-domain-containing membrane protein
MFYKDRIGYVPVIDSNDCFVGEITMTDLFSICIPSYALKMQNLKFLSHFEPLEDLLRNENNIHIGDVMKKPSVILDPDSPVVEAVLKFVQCRRRYLPVVKKDTHLIGVVGYMDVLKKVLRA